MNEERVRCPLCGKMIQIVCLASNPPQYEAGCGWCKFSMRYFHRQDPRKIITQEELNKHYEELTK
jgi:hypothetical protein